ncbi:MAG: hypothetical protein IT233_01385 [Bacteroidia bacterium]|nr:hypothetical protein [Bacteroidia bacterium]
MRRAGIILILIPALLLPSCLIVKRQFRRGYYLDFNRSGTSRGETIPPLLCKQLRKTPSVFPDSAFIPLAEMHTSFNAEPKKNILPTIRTKRIVSPLSHPGLRFVKRPLSVPPDPFSTATFITALLLACFVPPLGAFLAFGKGRIFRNDLWLYAGGGVLFTASRLLLLGGGFGFGLALIILAGFALLGASFLYTVFHLLRAFFRRPPEP